MKALGATSLILSLFVSLAAAQSVDDILAKYIQAVGGKSAIEKVSSRTMKGTLDNSDDGSTSPIEVYAKPPSNYVIIANMPNYGIVQTTWAGDKGWMKNPDSGVQEMSKSDAAMARRDYDFYREIRLKDIFPKMSLAGKARTSNHDTFVVEATTPEGTSEKLYFDAQSGLLVRRDFERVTLDDGIILYQVDYDDYKDIDGVKIPFTIIRKTADYSLSYRFTDVKLNVPVEDSRFSKPEK